MIASRSPRLRLLALLVIVGILATYAPAQALTQVATVVASRGQVQAIDPAGAPRTLALKAAIYEQDTLQTGNNGQLQILFTDNSLINLGRQSEMKIAEYRWPADQKDGALKTKIKEGTFRVMGGALATSTPQNFTTETATATIGIRGSMYAGKTSAESLSVVFQGGKGIEITNALGMVVIDKPGFGTRVELDNPPQPPVKFSQQDLQEINKALEGNGAEKGQEEAPAAKNADQAGEESPPALSATMEASAAEDQQNVLVAADADLSGLSTSLLSGLQTGVMNDNAQDNLKETVNSTAMGTAAIMSGTYRNFLTILAPDIAPPNGPFPDFLAWDAGTVSATLSAAGILQGSLLSDGTSQNKVAGVNTSFGPYTFSNYAPAAPGYMGFAGLPDTMRYTDPKLGPLQLPIMNFGDPSGQFFYSTFNATLPTAPYGLSIASLLYAGQANPTTPGNRIDAFRGHLIHTAPGEYDAGLETMEIEVNYYNNRLIGRSFDQDKAGKDGAIFFGTVNHNGTASLTLLTGGTPDFAPGTDVTSAYGTGSALLYGDFHQGLAFTAAGSDYSLLANRQVGSWAATGAAMLFPDSEIVPSYPTSDLHQQGFVVGVADNTGSGAISRLFMNSTANDFVMTVNPSTGVVSGTINAADLISGGAVQIRNLTVGGSADNSAYVLNDQLVATLSGSNLALRDHGNFLATTGPDDALGITNTETEYLTWGTWEMAYTDPADASRDHLFASQSFWIAGQKTDPAYLSTNLLNQPITGTYNGKAFGVQTDAAGQNVSRLTNGASRLQVAFNNPNAANAVSGTINFDQAALVISSAASPLTANGFTANVATVSGMAPSTSAINGAFYGPSAQTVGGSFRAQLPDGMGYFGIFGGTR